MSNKDNNSLVIDPEVAELCRQLNEARDERDLAEQRLKQSTDWYQQRFNSLRKWVEAEVRPLSEEVARRYYAVCSNGSPSPHESADWSNTMHALELRIEQLERELKTAKTELVSIERCIPITSEGSVSQRVQEYILSMNAEKTENLRRLDSVIKMADYNAEHMDRHLVSLIKEREELRAERNALKADLNIADADVLMSERQMMQALKDEFKRGVESMRAKAIEIIIHNSHEDGPGLGSARIESVISTAVVDTNLTPIVRVKAR